MWRLGENYIIVFDFKNKRNIIEGSVLFIHLREKVL